MTISVTDMPADTASMPVRTMSFLLLVWSVLIGASLFQDLAGMTGDSRIWLLDVDVERGLYTWFSQLMLAGAGVLLLDTGHKVRRSDPVMAMEWKILGGLFLLLSIDEALSFHEMLSSRVRGVVDTGGLLTFAWVIPAAIICLIGFVGLLPFLRRLPALVRTLMILSAVLFLGGAIGMEMLGGKIMSDHGGDVTVLPYRLATTAEEGLEGLGVLLFIYSLLLYRRDLRVIPLLSTV